MEILTYYESIFCILIMMLLGYKSQKYAVFVFIILGIAFSCNII